ncbi:hypothetical protein EDB19DRAFT_2025309 [Suillus lakei]|nr:hypothetical protein EDB19DRAFT_2025309 [Suillus lakei]
MSDHVKGQCERRSRCDVLGERNKLSAFPRSPSGKRSTKGLHKPTCFFPACSNFFKRPQTGLKSMKLLPLTGAAKDLFTKSATKAAEPERKRKADGPAGQASRAKRGAGQSEAARGNKFWSR